MPFCARILKNDVNAVREVHFFACHLYHERNSLHLCRCRVLVAKRNENSVTCFSAFPLLRFYVVYPPSFVRNSVINNSANCYLVYKHFPPSLGLLVCFYCVNLKETDGKYLLLEISKVVSFESSFDDV